MTRDYYPATICKKGHVVSSSDANLQKHCSECGTATISNCPECNAMIRGSEDYGMPVLGKRNYVRPYYCYQCGKPYPWTSFVIDNAVELLSLDESIDETTLEIIRNAIPDLLVESPVTPLAVAKYNKYISGTQQYVKDGLKQLLVEVVAEAVKRSLFQQ